MNKRGKKADSPSVAELRLAAELIADYLPKAEGDDYRLIRILALAAISLGGGTEHLRRIIGQ